MASDPYRQKTLVVIANAAVHSIVRKKVLTGGASQDSGGVDGVMAASASTISYAGGGTSSTTSVRNGFLSSEDSKVGLALMLMGDVKECLVCEGRIKGARAASRATISVNLHSADGRCWLSLNTKVRL